CDPCYDDDRHLHSFPTRRSSDLENTIPWRSKLDMAFFKETTMGYPLVMGRKTYESLPGALKGRHLFVITRDKDWSSGTPKGESVDRKSTRLNSSHVKSSYAVFCL